MDELEKLYLDYSDGLYKFLLYMTNDHLLAEELLQETFFQAIKSIHTFKSNCKIKTWLYQIAKYIYYQHHTKNKINNQNFDESLGYINEFYIPEKLLVKKENEKLINYAIMKLKEPYKEVVILRLYDHLSFKEIGEILSQTENWARVTFHRGKQKLQAELKKKGD